MDSPQLSAAIGFPAALIVFAISATLACGERDKKMPVPTRGQSVRQDCPRTGEDDHFFPAESLFPADPDRDHDRRLSLSNYLLTAETVSLSCSGVEMYRVIWFGGYDQPVLIVTVDSSTAMAVEFLPFNLAKRSIKNRQSKAVSAEQFQQIASGFESAGLWSADAVLVFESDGSSWTFEGRRGNSYRALTRTHPDPALANIGRSLVALAGVMVPSRMSPQSN